MKRLNNSDFDLIQNIIKDIDFNYEETSQLKKEELFGLWKDIIGEKISKFSKPMDLSSDGILTIACSDSFVANELYFEKDKIFSLLQEKSEKMGIKLKDIKFDYRKWKE